MDWIINHKKGCGCAALVCILSFILTSVISGCYRRVDPGNAGILINYAAGSTAGKPVITTIQPGQYVFIPPFSGLQLTEYPIAQQQLILTSRSDEGELQGDSTIACQMNGGGVLHMGLTVSWQVNSDHPEILYLKRPGIPLTSSLNDDINTTLVYGFVRGDLLDVCTRYSWQDVLGDGNGPSKIDTMKTELLQRLQSDLSPDGILVSQIAFNERTPDATIQAVLNARNDAQKSAYLKQQAEYQAQAEIAKAQGDAQSIAVINQQLSKSPEYLNYLAVKEWDGHMPQYIGSGSNNPILSVASGGK